MDQDVLDLRRLDWIVRNYSELGALRLVPMGVPALVMAFLVGGLVELSAYWQGVVGMWSLGGAVAGYWLVTIWYRSTYGMTLDTWPISERYSRRKGAAWAGATIMVAVGVADFGLVAELLGYLAGVVALAWMLLYWRRTGRMWPQSYSLMALLVTGGLLHWAPLLSVGSGYASWLLALLGTAMMVVGIVEHLRLSEVAKPLGEDEDGE